MEEGGGRCHVFLAALVATLRAGGALRLLALWPCGGARVPLWLHASRGRGLGGRGEGQGV